MSSRSPLTPEVIAALESGVPFVTPNQRIAHRLQVLYANHCVALGRTAWVTSAISSFDAFALSLWRESSAAPERILTAQQSRLLWERIVGASGWSERLLSPMLAAGSAYRSWERLHLWRIGREVLADHAVNNEEAGALLEWSDRFAEMCAARSWVAEAIVPVRLLQVESPPRLRSVATLTDDWAPLHRALFEHLTSLGVRWDRYDAVTPVGATAVSACDSPDAELSAAAAWSRQQLAAGKRSIAIAVPRLNERATAVRRVFAEVFAQATRTFVPDISGSTTGRTDRQRQEVSFAIASYRRLADFPVVRAGLDLLELLGGRASLSRVGSILRSPFFLGTDEASARALADAQLRSDKREQYDLATLEQFALHANCPVLGNCLRLVQSLKVGAPLRALPSAMAEHIVLLLKAFGWPGERALDSDEQQVVARLHASVAEFGALDELLGPLTFAQAIREFEMLVRNTTFEPRSLPAPITVVDSEDAGELQFEALWVAGMDESRWPPPSNPDPFIPIELQVRARMPFASARLARESTRDRFELLQRSADEIVFSWARKDEDVELLPSPWLDGIPTAAGKSAEFQSFAARMFSLKPATESLREDHAPPFARARARGGTRIFELQSQCPFHAYAELRLDAQKLEAIVPSIDARDRGVLIHAALADIWEELRDSFGLEALTGERMTSLVRTAVARHAKPLLAGSSLHRARMLQIEQELAVERILELLELDRVRAPFRVVGRPETMEQSTVGPLTFELRLDRVDELIGDPRQRGRVIVDYKTGASLSTKAWMRERPEQPQLPLYAVTHPGNLAAVTFATLSAKETAYRGVAREADILPDVKAFDGKDLPPPFVEWDGLLAYWRTVIGRLADEFASGNARVDPLKTACRYCHLSALCRINEQQVILDEEIDEDVL